MRQAFGVDHTRSSSVGLRFAALLALVAASLIGAGSGSEAKGREQKTAGLPSSDDLPGFQQTTPLWAWADFCNRHRSECAADAAEPSVFVSQRRPGTRSMPSIGTSTRRSSRS